LKCLDEKIPQSLDLLLRFINEADFTCHQRIKDLVMEMKAEIDSNLSPMGHMFAMGRASRLNSRSKNTEETWAGLFQIEFVHSLAKLAEENIASVSQKLEYLRDKISGFGIIANITGGSLKTAGSEFEKRFCKFGSPVNRGNIASTGKTSGSFIEVFASPSLQIGFAGRTAEAAPFDSEEQIAELVLAHQLYTGALWENIRTKGGAYGAVITNDSLENCVSISSYRDPDPLRSVETVSEMFKNDAYGKCTEDFLVKSIIGCYGKETRPRTGAENGLIDFYRFLYGISDDYRKRRMERLVSVSASGILSAFNSMGKRPVTGTVIIAGVKAAEQAAKKLGVEMQMLPV
jgi:Zn-dependent M16 (insulinase) family peptidase